MCRMRQGPTNKKTIPLIWIGQAFRQRLGGKRKGKKYPLASVWISSQRVGDQNKRRKLKKNDSKPQPSMTPSLCRWWYYTQVLEKSFTPGIWPGHQQRDIFKNLLSASNGEHSSILNLLRKPSPSISGLPLSHGIEYL